MLVTPALLDRLKGEGIADKELSALLARDLLVPTVHDTTYLCCFRNYVEWRASLMPMLNYLPLAPQHNSGERMVVFSATLGWIQISNFSRRAAA